MANVFGLDTLDNLDVSTLYINGVNVNQKFVSTSDFNQSNSGKQLQLQNYVTPTVLATTLTRHQRTIAISKKYLQQHMRNPRPVHLPTIDYHIQ